MIRLNRTASVSFVFGICLLLFVLGTFSQARGATYTVNTNADNTTADNLLTLREAILIAKGGTEPKPLPLEPLGRCLTNAERRLVSGMCYLPISNRFGSGCWFAVPCGGGGSDTRVHLDPDIINFTNAVTTIALRSPLPTVGLTDSIDGMKPDGSKVTIDGTSAGSSANGISLYLRQNLSSGYSICNIAADSPSNKISTNNRITNLVITNFGGHGIEGISVQSSVFQGLEISRNGGSGIFLHSVRCGAKGDLISHSNLIGGTDPAQRNFIFSNRGHGIDLDFDPTVSNNPAAHNNRIEGNFIGSARLPGGPTLGLQNNGNTLTGVHLRNVRGSVVGGDNPAMSNLIVGNGADGVKIEGANATGNVVRGNLIGVGLDNATAIPNAGSGVILLDGANGNIIGAPVNGSSTRANVIAFNMADGVTVSASTGNSILLNSIFSNARLGINLFTNPESGNHVTANDRGDADGGSNNLQNSPEISAVEVTGTTTRIRGTLRSLPGVTYRTEFFLSPGCDASGSGEGQTFIAMDKGDSNTGGEREFNVRVDLPIKFGQAVTATATNVATGDTSEFSACFVRTIGGLRRVPDNPPPTRACTNYALAANGGVASASSLLAGAAYPASAANNGDRKGLGFDQGTATWGSGILTTPQTPQWLQIDFNGPKTIDLINVVTLQDDYRNPIEPTETTTFTLYGIQDFDVQYWNGTTWQSVLGTGNLVVGNNRVLRSFTFPPQRTTKVRVLITKSPDQISRIVELEALGCSR